MPHYDTVERSAGIAAPPEQILPWLVDFRRWVQWSPWEGMDPAIERSYSGPESGVGAHYEWSGNRKAGAGSMEITSAGPTTVEIALHFTRPFKSTSRVTFVLAPTATGAHVVWRMRSPRTLPGRVFGIFMNMDKMIGADLAKGLAGLNRAVTSQV